MPTYRFEELRTRRQHVGKCPNCGKRVSRSRSFEQTVNPFNKNADGTVKSRDEVWAAVKAEADAWVPDFTHCSPEEALGL